MELNYQLTVKALQMLEVKWTNPFTQQGAVDRKDSPKSPLCLSENGHELIIDSFLPV